MNIIKEDLYIAFTPKEENNFNAFFELFSKEIDQYESNNIIVDLNNFSISLAEISQFEKISEKKVGLGTSFVVIYTEVDLDEIPDELIVVPTFQEAIDIIDMDEMTRSLDF
jgi:hypothetical protein